jgi:MFS family permease
MTDTMLSRRFLAVTATNFCLFLIVTTWSFLPVFIVERGGTKVDAGLIMGSIGITSLGSLPFLAPLIDLHGRKLFIVAGILGVGLSNVAFLFFAHYSPLMIFIRLFQGLAFAACFNGCATAVVDLIPKERRAQGIGLFGISGSLAMAIGPYLGEICIINWGFTSYFLLLLVFGLIGLVTGLLITESASQARLGTVQGFFPTALRGGHIPMMMIAATFGAGFSAMLTFFPLYAKELGIRSGVFFVCYGITLVFVRVVLGRLADALNREKLIFACLVGFAITLVSTSRSVFLADTIYLGILFGVVQGLSYPAMMARMVDKSSDTNRAVVVALFTGSFGVGIHVASFMWGAIADRKGLSFMFLFGGLAIFALAVITAATYRYFRARGDKCSIRN